MGFKSRSGWRVDVCFRGDCIHHNTDECKECIRFDMYEERKESNNELQQVQEQDLPRNKNSMQRDGEVSKG